MAPDLTLRDVTFAYGPHSEPVLRNLNLTVPGGDHLAIVGPSGIGKSTLAGLLCGLRRPTAGTVRVGDEVAVELDSDRLAGIRTLIPQEAYVFAGSVWDNLTYLCSTATPRQVDNAVAALGAEPLIAKLGGVAAQLAPDELSAGERQLIALVRSYLSAAPVAVLDEASCHLDPAAERRVEEAFAVRPGTLVVIAHRVSSALRARRILVLDGAGAAVGDHLTLLAASPLYRELLGHWQAVPATEATRQAPAGQQRGAAPPAAEPVPVASAPAQLPAAQVPAVQLPAAQVPARLPGIELVEAAVGAAHTGNGSARANGSSAGSDTAGSTGTDAASVTAAISAAWWRRARGGGPEPDSGAPDTDHRVVTGTAGPGTGETEPAPSVATGPADSGSPPRPWIFGQVSEGGKGSLEGATLTLTDLSGRQLDRDVSDAGGHYRLGPPAGGSYLVICASGVFQPTAALVAVADVPVRHDVVLWGGGASVSGCVSAAEDGSAIAGAVVTLVDARGDVVGASRTGVEGRFGFAGLGQGHYTVTVAAAGLQPVAEGVEVPAGGQVSHDVVVASRVQLVGVVRSASAGLPVAEALATLIAGDGQVVGSQITDERGGFVFDDLSAGVYTVIATGYPPVAAEVSLGSGEQTETVITLRPSTLPDSAGDGSVRGPVGAR